MAVAPKPKPPKRCACKACRLLRDRDAVRKEYMGIIASSYTRDELKALIQAARATMLPRDEG